MTRTGLVTLVLSATAVLAYLVYRAVVLVPVPSSPTIVAASDPVEVLPEFSLDDLAGEPRSIQSWPEKALVINFWATWCAPCLREIPLLKEFQDEQATAAVQVVGIAVDRLDPVQKFVTDMDFNYPVLVGQSDAMNAAAAFGVDFFALPFSVFTDTQSNILGVHIGELHPEDLENLASVLADLRTGETGLDAARARLAGRR